MTSVRDQLASFSSKLRSRLGIVARNDLSPADVELIYDVLTMRLALLHDLLDGSTQAESTATWERTILGLTDLDVELYARDWKTLREILTSADFRQIPLDDSSAAISAFKQAASGRIHYKWILNSALSLIGGDAWYSKVNQWIVFDSHVNLSSLNLQSECCADYIAFEDALPDPRFWCEMHRVAKVSPSRDYPDEVRWMNTVQRCAKDMFGDFRLTEYPFRPKHGNGATAEVDRAHADPWHKNRHFAVDGEIINYLRYRVPEEEWQDMFYLPYRGLERTCELVCVPKSMTSNRTISKEPTTLQFLQQDIASALDDYFSEHPWLGIDLHSQEKSRELALVGSAEGSYATIDLSSASDSVTVALVEFLFEDLPILHPLMCTRSTSVHVATKDMAVDTVIQMRKFAPMGSSTCFPVETMVFAIMCEAAVRLTTGRKSRWNDYRVYGDDIVIRSDYAPTVRQLLEYFGFTVNASKSFGIEPAKDTPGETNRFREACGIEAINGVDITPLRLSRRLVSLTLNDSDHQAGLGVGMVDLLNRAYIHGYWTLRRWINDQLICHKWYRTCLRLAADDYRRFAADILNKRKSYITVAVPFVITDETSATQWRAFKAISGLASRFHRCAALVTTASSRGPRVVHHDSNDYYSWCLEARTHAVADEIFVIDDTGIVTIRPRDLRWSKEWVSLQRPALLQQYCPY